MKNLIEYISEVLKIGSKSKVNSYNYQPKDKKELRDIIRQLIKERGSKANLNDIDTSNIKDMSQLFYYSKFDGDISEWNVSNVRTMEEMFAFSKFTSKNGDISKWDVSNVKNMRFMFLQSPLKNNPPKWLRK